MPDLVMLEQHPAYRPTIAAREVEAAAEAVAEQHFSTCSPEFNEWFVEQDYYATFARLVRDLVMGDDGERAEARRKAVQVYGDWLTFVQNASDVSCWPLERQMHREVRNGL